MWLRALGQFRLTDSAGNEINTVVPFVLVGLPVTLSSSFSDPGVLDRQTAAIAWGDGASDPHTAFTTFDEAFGDGAGALSHQHAYSAPGTFPIGLTVADDDGGVDTETAVVRVLTPEQAVVEIIAILDNLIASTTDSGIRKDLEKARKALAGNPNGSNGALERSATAMIKRRSRFCARRSRGSKERNRTARTSRFFSPFWNRSRPLCPVRKVWRN